MLKLLISTLFVIISLHGISQVKNLELVTDRPDQTESALVVPKNSLQVESGFIREGGVEIKDPENQEVIRGMGPLYTGFKLAITEGDAEHLFDAGFTYLLKQNIQLDVSGGVGINDPALDKMISCGLSFRLPR